jgi:hypothetical protein
MNTAIDRVRTKIAELEAKLADLRIAERELRALEVPPAKKPSPAARPEPSARPKPTAGGHKAKGGGRPKGQTITGAVVEILRQQGTLTVPAIAKEIKSTGGKIGNRSVYYSLRELKKRGLAAVEGKNWTLIEPPSAAPTDGS